MASSLLPVKGHDETPEGRSVVEFAKRAGLIRLITVENSINHPNDDVETDTAKDDRDPSILASQLNQLVRHGEILGSELHRMNNYENQIRRYGKTRMFR